MPDLYPHMPLRLIQNFYFYLISLKEQQFVTLFLPQCKLHTLKLSSYSSYKIKDLRFLSYNKVYEILNIASMRRQRDHNRHGDIQTIYDYVQTNLFFNFRIHDEQILTNINIIACPFDLPIFRIIQLMFYLITNLRTELFFTPYEMDKLSRDQEIIKRLKQKVQGKCLTEYGYIVQCFDKSEGNSGEEKPYKISAPVVEENGIKVSITFLAMAFKPQKNDIIDIMVQDVQQDMIKGKLGHAWVFIVKSKMGQGWTYKKDERIFINQNVSKISKGTKLRCKCFQVNIEMNQMKILAQLNEDYLGPLNS